MTKKIPTKTADKREYADYWKKARDFLFGMRHLYLEGNWNSTALEGIHAAISASDAVLIFLRGYKSSSQRHLDVATLISDLPAEGAKEAAQQLSKILCVKSLVEYSGDNYLPEDAQEIAKRVERFFNWAGKIFPR